MKLFYRIGKDQRGHTLLELLIAIVILVFIAMGIFMFSTIAQTDLKKMTANTISLSRARIAMEYLKRDILTSKGLIASFSTYSTSDSSLVMSLYPLDASGNIDLASADEDHVVYGVSGTDLIRRVIPHASSTRSASVDDVGSGISNSVLFSYNGTSLSSVGDVTTVDNLKINLIVTTGLHMNRSESQTISTLIYLRNY